VRGMPGAVAASSSVPGAESGCMGWLESALSRKARSCFVLFKGI